VPAQRERTLRDRIDAWQGWAPAALLLGAAIDRAFFGHVGPDFHVFYTAAGRFLRGEALYRLADGGYPFKYAPAAALAFGPLQLMGERAAWAIHELVCAFALARVARLSSAALPVRPGVVGHALVFLAIMPLYARLLALGQTDAALVWLAMESEALADRRPAASGALLALAAAFKQPFLVLLVPAVALRQRRRVTAALIATGALLLAGAARYGWAGNLAQLRAWRELVAGSMAGGYCVPTTQGAAALACAYVATRGPALALSVALLAAVGSGLVVLAWWRTRDEDAALARAVASAGAVWLAAFLSPICWAANLLCAMPILYLLVAVARAAPRPGTRGAAWAVLLAVVALVNVSEPLLPEQGRWLSEHRHVGVAMAVAAATALAALAAEGRLRRAQPPAAVRDALGGWAPR
jgi:hypothetical protein